MILDESDTITAYYTNVSPSQRGGEVPAPLSERWAKMARQLPRGVRPSGRPPIVWNHVQPRFKTLRSTVFAPLWPLLRIPSSSFTKLLSVTFFYMSHQGGFSFSAINEKRLGSLSHTPSLLHSSSAASLRIAPSFRAESLRTLLRTGNSPPADISPARFSLQYNPSQTEKTSWRSFCSSQETHPPREPLILCPSTTSWALSNFIVTTRIKDCTHSGCSCFPTTFRVRCSRMD